MPCGCAHLFIRLAQRIHKNKNMSNLQWIVETVRGEVRIDLSCAEMDPCQHSNSLNLNSVELWRLIRQSPELQQTKPDLWKHFSKFENTRYANF